MLTKVKEVDRKKREDVNNGKWAKKREKVIKRTNEVKNRTMSFGQTRKRYRKGGLTLRA